MTTPTPSQLRAAFEYGREIYLSEQRKAKVLAAWEAGGGMQRVYAALNPSLKTQASRPTEPVIGGGSTMSGRIRWLIDNNPGISGKEIKKQIGGNVMQVLQTLHQRGIVERKGTKGKFCYWTNVKFSKVERIEA